MNGASNSPKTSETYVGNRLNGNEPLFGAIVFRHHERANVVWCDGHAKSIAPGQALQKASSGALRIFTTAMD